MGKVRHPIIFQQEEKRVEFQLGFFWVRGKPRHLVHAEDGNTCTWKNRILFRILSEWCKSLAWKRLNQGGQWKRCAMWLNCFARTGIYSQYNSVLLDLVFVLILLLVWKLAKVESKTVTSTPCYLMKRRPTCHCIFIHSMQCIPSSHLITGLYCLLSPSSAVPASFY